MLKLLCEDLLSFRIMHKTQKEGRDILTISTSNKLVRKANKTEMDANNSIDVSNEPFYIPLNREILKIYSSDVNERSNNDPISIKVYDNDKNIPQIEINTLTQGSPNRSNIYLVAFPFNGMIAPIPEDPTYRIYKGILATSVKPFYINNTRYRKVLYLVIEPNLNLFTKDHKYHKDKIEIKLESFAVYKDKNDDLKEKTNHHTYVLTITDQEGNYTESHDNEIINHGVGFTNEPTGNLLWTTFRFTPKEKDENETEKTKNGRKVKEDYRQGDILITTNKHGIRKEVNLKPHKNNEDWYDNDYDEEDYNDYVKNTRSKKTPKKKKSQWR